MKILFTSKIARSLAFLSLLAGLATVPLFGAHDTGLFELDTRGGVEGDQEKKNDPPPLLVGDGNTIDEAAAGDDWENIYCDVIANPLCTNPMDPVGLSNAFAISWIEDTFANNNVDNGAEPFVFVRTPEDTFFTGGGSKDTNGIQDGPWKYKIVSDQVPDKNDIVNAFAAAYDFTYPVGHPRHGMGPDDDTVMFYFGLDTFSVNGDANAGFWFFRQPVSLGPLDGDTGTFIGEHTTGDIFVAVAYTQGGRIGDIDVYEWIGDDATGSLVLKFSGLDCAEATAGDDVCGVINKLFPDQTFGEDPIFDYANTLVQNNPLDPTSYQYESAAFVEFGLDVEAVLGQEIGCFTTFLAETRSSQSETAQLKDFAFGNFPICGIAVDKTGDTLSKIGDDVDYTITVTNTGKATLHKQSIIDSVFGDLTDGTNPLITGSDCGATLAPEISCTITVTRTVEEGDPDPLDNTVTVVYTELPDPASLSFTDSDDHSVNLFQPAVAADKTGDDLSKIGDDVDYTITLSNNSSDDTPAMNCTAEDSLLGTVFDGVLPLGDTVLTPSRTVEEGDPDPLVNTVTLTCSPEGFPNVLEETDDHSTNLFQPAIAVDKTGDDLSKIGDDVDYTITLSNNSSADTPDLDCTATDTMFGEVFSGVLPLGDTVINRTRTVQEGDPDPLVNTVTLTCSPAGFPNVLEESDGHSTNLFQPAIAVDKTGDDLSKIGDDVDYTITLSNNSSADTPAMDCTAEDTLLGTLFDGVLPLGDTVLSPSRTVEEGDPDPLVNTVTLTCSPAGFPNVLEESDGHSTNLFQPAIAVDKTGDDLSKIGDDVDYTITLSNNSSADTPAMDCTAEDTLLGTLFDGVLPLGDTVLTPSRTVEEGDPDPLVNTVTLTCSPDGFPNVLEESDGHSTNLFQPAIAVDKTGDDLSKIGDDVDYTITLSNNSSADTPAMDCTAEDTLLGTLFDGVLPLGDTVLTPSRTVEEGDPDPLVNTVTLTCSPDGFPNVLEESDGHSTNLFQPAIAVDKTGDDLSKIGDDVDYTITLSNNSSADTPAMDCTAEDTLLGTLFDGVLPLGDTVLTPSRTVLEGDPDPLVNTVTLTCSPDGFPNVLEESDGHSTNLFQPAIAVDKTGDDLSKVGDDVDYTITLSNNSSADTPAMNCTATDSLLGTLFDGVLPLGDTVLSPSRTVEEGDPDPLVNTVTLTCSPAGFPNVLEESDGHSTNLFQPAIAAVKTGDELSKVGDDVDYTITLSNNSSADTPALNCVATDSLLGEVFNGTLPLGDTVIDSTRTVQMGDSDPLPNTVSVVCGIAGFPNVLNTGDNHEVNLFQPAVEIVKTADCDVPVVIGETITYSFTINNLSSADSPDLVLDSINDTVLGDIGAAAAAGGCSTLAAGGSCNFDVMHDTSLDPAGPLVNVVTVHYHPGEFSNDISDDDDHSCDIVLPAPAMVRVEKRLLNAEGVDFGYTATGLPLPGFTLTPLFANSPQADSPFPPLEAGESFHDTINFVVNFQNINDTEVVTVDETFLGSLTVFVSLQCEAAIGGFLTNPAGIAGTEATLNLKSGDFAICQYVNEFPFEGCTPGYWRNHFDSWGPTGLLPSDDFDFTFGVDLFFPDISLGEAINLGGGDVNKLARHGTAALLSALHPDVFYPYTPAEVIAFVQAGNVDPLAAANELGCPID